MASGAENDLQPRLDLIRETSYLLTLPLDLNELLDRAIAATIELTASQYGLLILCRDVTVYPPFMTIEKGSATQGDRQFSQAVIRQVVNSREQIFVENDKLYIGSTNNMGDIETGFGSIICSPLQAAGELVGAIFLAKPAGVEPFSRLDHEMCVTLANMAASTVMREHLARKLGEAKGAASNFVSVVSHELRIPMTAIKGFSGMLKTGVGGPLNEQQSQFNDTVLRNVERMRVLISDLNDIDMIDNDQLYLEMEPVQTVDVVQMAANVLQKVYEDKGQQLLLQVPEKLPVISADRSRIIQVLKRTAYNASQYSTENKEIQLIAQPVNDSDRNLVRISVVDQGIGITEKDMSSLFSPFFRSEDPFVRESDGWGLSLVLVKKLVELQGGAVSVKSSPGIGSTFSFTFPVAAS